MQNVIIINIMTTIIENRQRAKAFTDSVCEFVYKVTIWDFRKYEIVILYFLENIYLELVV